MLKTLIRKSVAACARGGERLTAVEYAILGGLIAAGLTTVTLEFLEDIQAAFDTLLPS